MAEEYRPIPMSGIKPKSTGLFGFGDAPSEEENEVKERKLLSEFRPLKAKERLVQRIEDRGIKKKQQELPGFTHIPSQFTPEAKGVQVPGQHSFGPVDIVNFLVGSEMAVAGIKMDTEGLSWEWENMKQQWSEEPLWINLLATTSLVGAMAFPAARAAWVTAKFGTVGKALPKMSVPLLGKIGGVGKNAEEIQRFKALNMLEEGFEPSTKQLRLLRQQEHYRSKYMDYAAKLELNKGGELKGLGPVGRLKFEFDKRFANSYLKIASSLVEGTSWRKDYHANLDKLWKSEDLGRFFVDMPDAKEGDRIMQYYLHRVNPRAVPNPRLSGKDLEFADSYYAVRKTHQAEMLEDGMITPETFERIGEAHFPALFKDTPAPNIDMSKAYLMPLRGKKPVTKPGALVLSEEAPSGLGKLFGGGVKHTIKAEEGTQYIALSSYKIPRLDGDTLKMRKSDIPEVYQKLLRGELITDPADITLRGHVMSKLLHENFKTVRDISMDPRYSVSHFDIMAKYKTAEKARKAGYISFEDVGEGIGSRIRRMMDKKGANLDPNDRLPWVRKEIFEEIFDDSGMFAQSVFGADMMELLTTIHKTSKTGLSIPTHFQNLVGNFTMLMQAGFNPLAPDNVKIQGAMAKAFNQIAHVHKVAKEAGHSTRDILDKVKMNLGKITVDGKTFNLDDELLNPMVRELVEESAFESTEGFRHIKNLNDRLRDDQHITKVVAEGFLGLKKLAQLGDTKGFKWFDQMTKWYLGEDMVPKMAYYMKLRASGLTRESAVLEVGRRLPMYATVGSSIKLGRKFMFPWASFPTEALRITKNNMMDNPLRMAPWLHMPQIMQTMLSATDPSIGSPGLVKEAKAGLPMYGQKPTTVVSDTETAAGLGGLSSGGVIGAVAGGIRGGPIGAAIGGIAGAYGGKKAAEYMSDDSSGDVLRGSILNWLPHSSFFLTTNSPDYTLNGGPWENLQQLQEQLPAEPLAILKPLIDIAAGKTDFGADIGATGFGDQVGKALAGFIGFVAPPWIQKYGLKTTTPDITTSQAAFGQHIPGDFTNVSKLLIDTGASINPMTGKPGNLSLDFMLGNFGMWKSYASDPKTQLANEVSTDANMERHRSTYVKNLDYFLQNGDDAKAMEILTAVQSTFAKQYADNPRLASEKYGDWLDKLRSSLGKHPKLRRWNQDELNERLRAARKFAGNERGKAREALMKTIKDELMIRKLSKKSTDSDDRNRPQADSRSQSRERGA